MNILVIHASAGAGHQKAAEALGAALQAIYPNQSVCRDALDYTSRLFKQLYRRTYSFCISRVPWLWGILFYILDVPLLQPGIRVLRRIQNHAQARLLELYLIEEQFNCIFSTHFFPIEVAAHLKRKGKIAAKIICVITDYDVHRIWLAEGVDLYAVACHETKEKLISLGVPDEKIRVTGIPVHEKFSYHYDIGALKKQLVMKENVFTVLIATGSFGIGPIEKVIDKLKGVQSLVVCGHNKKLFERLTRQNRDLVKIFGLVDNMHELMAVSDCMITKPGGLSITEALVRQLPLIFFNAIPGQETNNVKVLRQHGIGISDCSLDTIAREIQRLSTSHDAFMTVVKKTQSLAHPDAVKEIIGLLP